VSIEWVLNVKQFVQLVKKDHVRYVLQEEEVDDEDISDTENTAMPACELRLYFDSF